jgi:hypothetical protein
VQEIHYDRRQKKFYDGLTFCHDGKEMLSMVDRVLVDVDIVTEYIEAAIADPLLLPAERDMMLTLREVPDSVMWLAQFETTFFGINPHRLASLEDTERHLRRREATLHAMESRLRAVAGELGILPSHFPMNRRSYRR